MLSEAEIIERLKNKDTSVVQYLYDHYSAVLYGIVLHIVKNETLAEDVLQEVFLKIWHNADSYDPRKGKLYTWMLNVARNSAIDITRGKNFKKNQKNQSFESNVEYLESKNTTAIPIEQIGVKELVHQLEDSYKMIIEKVYFEGYTLADAAKELGIPLGTLKTRLNAALQLLRKKV
ncbi:MAG: sigma-70 family RNA polymerase sigma factor [Bacteroidia bacterium]|nr:sigma-70 family RNA polymerase sigma factor [Bacteroidia bacterium]MDW8300908.1 sigma-70 family RNA polymerase sigma factor [Bacteroidia bacterium]